MVDDAKATDFGLCFFLSQNFVFSLLTVPDEFKETEGKFKGFRKFSFESGCVIFDSRGLERTDDKEIKAPLEKWNF